MNNSYGRDYYLKNKEYLLKYQKWYMLNKKYEKGEITEDMLIDKPMMHKEKKKKIKEDKRPKIIYGNFIIFFD